MKQERRRELLDLIRELQSPIEAERVEQVTASAALRIRELMMEVEKYETDIASRFVASE